MSPTTAVYLYDTLMMEVVHSYMRYHSNNIDFSHFKNFGRKGDSELRAKNIDTYLSILGYNFWTTCNKNIILMEI